MLKIGWLKVITFIVTATISATTVYYWGWNTNSQFSLSLLAGLYISYLFYTPRKRRPNVHFVAKAVTSYSNLVLEGFQSHISGEVKLTIHRPSLENSENVRWQVDTIKKIQKNKLDVLVIVPAGKSDEFIDTVIDLRRSHVQVVLLDYKFKNKHFIDRGLLPPQFVHADPLVTGNLLGSVVEERVHAGVENLVFILGNKKSAVALYRTQATILRGLQAARLKSIKISLIELRAWTYDHEAKKDLFTILDMAISREERVLVVCANDAVMDEVDRSIPEKYLDNIELLGCDGGRHQDGRSILETSRCGIATVDINPRGQGETAADLVNLRIDREKSKREGYHVRQVEQYLVKR